MDLEEINAQLESLEEQCVSNVEYHFNQYIAMDYSEAGFDADNPIIITDVDYYLYWLTIANRVNDLLSSLLYTQPYNEETTHNVISLKKIVDSKLLKYGEDEERIFKDLTFQNQAKSTETDSFIIENNPIRINGEGFEKEELIENFYKLIKKNGLIDTPFNLSFKEHFEDKTPTTKLIWELSMKDLTIFFRYLSHRRFIFNNEQSLTNLLIYHFEVRDLPELIFDSVRRTLNKTNFRDIEELPKKTPYLKDIEKYFIKK